MYFLFGLIGNSSICWRNIYIYIFGIGLIENEKRTNSCEENLTTPVIVWVSFFFFNNMWESLSVLFWTWMSYLSLPFFFLAEIPENEYIKYFSPDFSLRIPNGHIVCHQLEFIILHYTLFKRLDFFFLWTNLIATADVGSM